MFVQGFQRAKNRIVGVAVLVIFFDERMVALLFYKS